MTKQATVKKEVDRFMSGLVCRNPGEIEFHQAVNEVVESIMPFVLDHQDYRDARVLERLSEPDRTLTFRVVWEDDARNVQVNRAWRVQFNNCIGPYKGGLRFHPSVNLSILKFLGFEQIFKNSLTGLPMGGGKGGSNFDPKGKSDREVERFCKAMMVELHRHIGEDTDIPAGDIGVGAREISYLFGQYLRLENRYAGILTGKGLNFGGSLIRTEATGYGCVYFCEHMLNHVGEGLRGKTVGISGSGNVAIYAAQKAMTLGAEVVTLSDSSGYIYVKGGLDRDMLEFVRELKETRRGRISEVSQRFKQVSYQEGERPWSVPVDVALPCATQNEIDAMAARALVANGVRAVCEGANMPTELEAAHVFLDAKVLFGPGKAANAGGVAVSGLEQSQNAQRLSWSANEVDARLQTIMHDIHATCVHHGAEADFVNYVKGANLGGFRKVADAMLAYGIY